MITEHSLREITIDLENSIRNGRPYDLTFAPTDNMTKEQKSELQSYLEYHFKLWAKSWIIPRMLELRVRAGLKTI